MGPCVTTGGTSPRPLHSTLTQHNSTQLNTTQHKLNPNSTQHTTTHNNNMTAPDSLAPRASPNSSAASSNDDDNSGVPHVVIIGNGYAGALLARELDQYAATSAIRLTVIDRTPFAFHKIGSIRASVQGSKWIDRALIPFQLKHGKFVIGGVVSVDEASKSIVSLRNYLSIPCMYLYTEFPLHIAFHSTCTTTKPKFQ